MSAFAFALLVLVLLALHIYSRYIEPNLILVRRIKIDTGGKIRNEKPLRIALVSDLHYPRYASFALIRRAIAKSNKFQPDLVFFLGDFFARSRKDTVTLPENVHETFEGIQNRFGIFGVLGNHDHSWNEQMVRDRIATDTEIKLIDNRAVPVEFEGKKIYIVGVGDLWAKNMNYAQAVRDVPEDAMILLLSHNPDVVEEINDPRIRMQFSGHTHGGQIRLPFMGALKVPSKFGNKYSQGLINTGNHLLYVNRGICSVRNRRFLCPPEVTCVEMW